MLKISKFFPFLVIFLALSCSNNKVSLDFSVGDCFVDMSNLAMTVDESDPEDRFNLETVEEVACSEPHNSEIYAEFSSVPYEYRSYDNPFDEACFASLMDYIAFLIPTENKSKLSENESKLLEILEEFDQNCLCLQLSFSVRENLDKGDIDNYFNCQLISINSLLFGKFEESIKKLF